MNKKVIRVLSILMLVAVLVCSFSQLAFAAVNPSAGDVEGWGGSDAGIDSVQNVMGNILSIVRVVAIGVAVIMLVVLAIKYISAAPGEKAEIKKSATIYIVGAVLLFAASAILTIIQNFATNITT